MAIPFLNNIDLSDNQLLNAKLQVTTTAPTAALGQIYFDSTSSVEAVKYYSNATDLWVSLKEYTFPAVIPANGFITSTVSGTFPKPILNFNLNATGTADNTTYLRGDNTWSTVSSIYGWTLQGDTGGPTSITNAAAVDIAGSGNITTALAGTTLTVNLNDSVSIGSDLTVGTGFTLTTGEIIQSEAGMENSFFSPLNMNDTKITSLLDPTAAQDAATKAYVDAATVGGLVYQGGYNAITNFPDLDSASSIAVEKGWTYTVTHPGLFFTEQVRVGDVIISEIDQAAGASALANWTTVQNNIDLASASQVGIGNVVASTNNSLDGLYVTYANPTDGTATVGLNIEGMNAASGLFASDLFFPAWNDDEGSNMKVSAIELSNLINPETSKTGTIVAGQTSGTVTHAFGINTIVQTINSSGDTVFCDVTRTATTSVATIAAAEATDITILVQKIG